MASVDMEARLGLKDDGYSEGIKSAQDALNKLNKEFGVGEAKIKSLGSQVSNAKKTYIDLYAAFSQLDEKAKTSKYGEAMAAQLEKARQKAVELIEIQKKAKEQLGELEKGGSSGGGFNVNKMVTGVLDQAGFGGASKAVDALGSALGGGAAMGAMAATAGIAAAGFALKEVVDVSAKAVKLSAEFGQSMSQLGAITGTSGKALDSMREQVISVGKDTHTAFKDVANNFALVGSALPELLKDAKGMEEVSRASITLSKAGLMPLGDATDALTSSMAQFDLGADQAATVVNVLANASQKGSAGISQVAETLKRCGTAANSAGVNLQQTAALTEVLAAKGLKGAEAGTALRNVLMNMSTKGIDEINPKVVGLETALQNLKAHASDASWMVQTFGQEGATAATIIANGIPQYQELAMAMDNVGTAAKMAEQNTQNLASKWADAQKDWDNFLASFNVDGANSPLIEVVQQIQNIISALDDMFAQLGKSEIVQDALSVMSETFGVLGQLISSVIEIVGDLVRSLLNIIDATGGLHTDLSAVIVVFKALKEVIWVVEAAVFYLTEAINWLCEQYRDLRSALSKSASKIPLLDTLNKALKTVCEWIQYAIDKWREFKQYTTDWMNETRQGPKDKEEKNGGKKGGKKKKDETDNTVPEKGLVEKLQDELKTLKEKRDKSQSKSEIESLNKQIQAKQKELNRLTGSSNKGGTSGTTKQDPLKKAQTDYQNNLKQIELEEQNLFITKKKAEEERISEIQKLIKAYIVADGGTGKYSTKIKELTAQAKNAKERLKKLADDETIENAEKEYAKELEKIRREKDSGLITETEAQDKLVKAMQSLVNKYNGVETMTAELKDKIAKKVTEINNIEFEKFADEFHRKYRGSREDITDIVNNTPKSNDAYRKFRDANMQVQDKRDEFKFRYQDSPDTSKLNLDLILKLIDDQKVVDLVNNFKSEKATLALNVEQSQSLKNIIDYVTGDDNAISFALSDGVIDTLKTINDTTKLTKEQFNAVKEAVDMVNASVDKGWEDQWLQDYNQLLAQNGSLSFDFATMFSSVNDAIRGMELEELSNRWFEAKSASDEAGKSAEECADGILQLVRKLRDEGIELESVDKEVYNIIDDWNTLRETAPVPFDVIEPKILEHIKDLGKVDREIDKLLAKYANFKKLNESTVLKILSPDSKGDKSNFNLKNRSYQSIETEVKYKTTKPPTKEIDIWQNQLDDLLRKYKEIEDIEVKLVEDAASKGIKMEMRRSPELDQLEAEINAVSDRIQAKLQFEMRIEGIRESVGDITSFLGELNNVSSGMNHLATIGNQWDQIGESASGAAEVFQKFSLIVQTAISIFTTFQSIMEIINVLEGIFAAKSMASAGATTAAATAQTAKASVDTAGIAPAVAATAANKALEASYLDLAAATIFAAHAAIPFAGVAIATGMVSAMMGAMAAQQAASLALTAYASGGIVDSNSFHGDQNLIRVNGDEMVLTRGQQSNLFRLLDGSIGGFGGNGKVEFVIKGDKLKGVMKNHNNKMNKLK